MKAHISVDAQSGLVHAVVGINVNPHDLKLAAGLAHGQARHLISNGSSTGRLPGQMESSAGKVKASRKKEAIHT